MHERRSLLVGAMALIGALLGACAWRSPPTPPAPQPPASEPASGVPGPAAATPSPALPAGIRDASLGWIGLTTPVEDVNVHVPDKYTIRFLAGERLEVRADCNRGTASYSVAADRRLEIGPIAMTRVACAPGSLSDRFAREVGRANRYFVHEGTLYLELPADSGTLRFRPL